MVESLSMLEVLRIIKRYVEEKIIDVEKVNFDVLDLFDNYVQINKNMLSYI